MQKQPSLRSRLRQNRLLYNISAIVLSILLLAVAAHFIMQAATRHGARRTVPDFTGIRIDDARRQADRQGLKLHINDSLFVPAYEGGIVLDQLPESGTRVKPGRTVYLTINSFRQKMVPVPYVAGRSLRQAKNMLEIAGLGIERLIYRSDMATNYVLEEYCGDRKITADSRAEAEMGSGVTLHVGVEGGYGTTVVPTLAGFSLQEARSRLWELGLNVGEVIYDEGINLLNQKQARVYLQIPGGESSARLGSEVTLRLSLDAKKTAEYRARAEKEALETAAERQRLEQERTDSLAHAALEEAIAAPAGNPEETITAPGDEFFD